MQVRGTLQSRRPGRGAGWAQPAGQRSLRRPQPPVFLRDRLLPRSSILPKDCLLRPGKDNFKQDLKNPPSPGGAGRSVLHISAEKREGIFACRFLCFRGLRNHSRTGPVHRPPGARLPGHLLPRPHLSRCSQVPSHTAHEAPPSLGTPQPVLCSHECDSGLTPR